MPKKTQPINAVIHIPDESALRGFRENTDKLFVQIVRKYLDNSALLPEDKQRVIIGLISEFKGQPCKNTAENCSPDKAPKE